MTQLIYTPGEPAGIGPDIFLTWAAETDLSHVLVIADETMLAERAKQLNLPFRKNFQIHHIACASAVIAGKPNSANARYVIQTLETAASIVQKNPHTIAWVTGPVDKGVLNQGGFSFTGHTEWLQQIAHVPQTVMLFANTSIKMALLTTHIALREVPLRVTAEKLETTLRLLHRELQQKFKIAEPCIAVCGLNPHAGENGYFGTEERDIMRPLFETLCAQGLKIIGPISADTAFTPFALERCDVVLSMYHDQGLPAMKALGFHDTVNVTLGLPFIRTSVDHGTALDLAGTGKADHRNLKAAFKLAIELLAHSITKQS